MTTLSSTRTLVRRDLKDEDSGDYRWTDNEIDRAIERAVLEYSEYCPLEVLTALDTVNDDSEVDISTLADRLDIVKVEHPLTEKPYPSRRFAVWADVLYFLEGYLGDGEDCNIYWLKKHTLGASSTIPTPHEGIVALGAAAFAISAQAQYQVDRANTGGQKVNRDYTAWAKEKFTQFYDALNRVKQYNPKTLKTSELTPEE